MALTKTQLKSMTVTELKSRLNWYQTAAKDKTLTVTYRTRIEKSWIKDFKELQSRGINVFELI